ncbi:MAG: PAC2 family protein [Sandaracinaceae bacterium]|nr:PAC2 family protein [Sandaracinaceae bacterium]
MSLSRRRSDLARARDSAPSVGHPGRVDPFAKGLEWIRALADEKARGERAAAEARRDLCGLRDHLAAQKGGHVFLARVAALIDAIDAEPAWEQGVPARVREAALACRRPGAVETLPVLEAPPPPGDDDALLEWLTRALQWLVDRSGARVALVIAATGQLLSSAGDAKGIDTTMLAAHVAHELETLRREREAVLGPDPQGAYMLLRVMERAVLVVIAKYPPSGRLRSGASEIEQSLEGRLAGLPPLDARALRDLFPS